MSHCVSELVDEGTQTPLFDNFGHCDEYDEKNTKIRVTELDAVGQIDVDKKMKDMQKAVKLFKDLNVMIERITNDIASRTAQAFFAEQKLIHITSVLDGMYTKLNTVGEERERCEKKLSQEKEVLKGLRRKTCQMRHTEKSLDNINESLRLSESRMEQIVTIDRDLKCKISTMQDALRAAQRDDEHLTQELSCIRESCECKENELRGEKERIRSFEERVRMVRVSEIDLTRDMQRVMESNDKMKKRICEMRRAEKNLSESIDVIVSKLKSSKTFMQKKYDELRDVLRNILVNSNECETIKRYSESLNEKITTLESQRIGRENYLFNLKLRMSADRKKLMDFVSMINRAWTEEMLFYEKHVRSMNTEGEKARAFYSSLGIPLLKDVLSGTVQVEHGRQS